MQPNFFNDFELEPRYDLDLEFLRQTYLQAQLDAAGNEERLSHLNNAYSTLKNDLWRAEHLLYLNKVDLSDSALKAVMSPDQLHEIWLELEQVELLQNETYLTSTLNAKLIDRRALISELTKAFSDNNMQDALDITIRLKYLTKLIDNINQRLNNADS